MPPNYYQIPSWLRGSLLRTGSAGYEMGKREYNHVFDGFAKLTRFHFNASGLYFNTRFMKSDIMKDSQKKQDITPHLCFEQPTPPFPHVKTAGVMEGPLDAGNINVWRTGDQFYSTCEQDVTNSFDAETLVMTGHTNYTTTAAAKSESESEAGISLPRISGAHPAREVDGDATFRWSAAMVVDPLKKPLIEVFKDTQPTPGGKLHRAVIGRLQVDWLSIMHSFPVTKNYIIMPQFPLGIKAMKALESLSVMSSVGWMGDTKPAYIHIFDAKSTDPNAGPVKTFKTDPFLSMHMINAYESVGPAGEPLVHFDCIGYNDGFLLTNPETFGSIPVMKSPDCCGKMGRSFSGTIRRYTLDMSPEAEAELVAEVEEVQQAQAQEEEDEEEEAEAEADPPASVRVNYTRHRAYSEAAGGELYNEMPRINDEWRGKQYCYFYAGVGLPANSPTMKDFHLTKVNMCGKGASIQNHTLEALTWSELNHYPSEGIFVQRPGATQEDNGVVMAPVLDGTKNQSYLLILDAASMKELARAYVPIRIPYDVHGHWEPAAAAPAPARAA